MLTDKSMIIKSMNRMLYITIITYIISVLRQVVALIILVERISYFQILIFIQYIISFHPTTEVSITVFTSL